MRAALFLIALLGVLPSSAAPTAAGSQGEQAAPSLQREECFVIEQLDPATKLDEWQMLGAPMVSHGEQQAEVAPHAVGLLLWRRSDGPAGRTLEWDVRFPERETRLLHVEHEQVQGTTLVFREMRPQAGRTLSADWLAGGETLRLREWSGPEGSQERLENCGGGAFALELLELLRAEQPGLERARVFDPLARCFEELTLRTQAAPPDGRWAGMRRIQLERADGTLAGAYLLRGTEVLGFQWQSGSLRMRRIEAEEYARRLRLLLSGPETVSPAD